MHSLVLIMLVASGCMAHYRGAYEARNLIEREEPHGVAGELVECPVCEGLDTLVPYHENCNIIKGGKRYKKCERGTYVNEVCGNRLDCYRGPREQCSEKMRYDVFGQKCARGLYCNDIFHVCTGLDFAIDSNEQWYLNNVYRFPLRSFERTDQDSLKAESAMTLA